LGKQKWIYRLRNVLASLPLIFAFIYNHGQIEKEFVIWGVGGIIFLAGIAVRIWAQQHLHYRMGLYKRLTTSGPYRFVRNPLYIGNILTYVGATIFSELIWFAPVTLLWAIGAYSLVVRYEEAHLLDKYGEAYQEYFRKVSRWIPKQIGFSRWGMVNQYLKRALLIEFRCVLILLPYIVKEILD
jgi:protein-S-isoprenylcysteine O-methyltransferase Ste14